MLIKDECLEPYLEAVKTARASLQRASLRVSDADSRAALVEAEAKYQRAYEQLWDASEPDYTDGW